MSGSSGRGLVEVAEEAREELLTSWLIMLGDVVVLGLHRLERDGFDALLVDLRKLGAMARQGDDPAVS